jgi:tetratricopeptide (TPR) repeat protein
MTKLASIFGRAYAALEAEDIDGVQLQMVAAVEAGADEDDTRLRYLHFMTGWLDEDASETELEELFAATNGLLDAAVVLEDPVEAARIALDIADIMISIGDIDDAEHALRVLSERGDLSSETDSEARLLRAQVLLDHQEDPEEALTVLDGVHASLHEDSGYVSLRAAVLVDLERAPEGIELLEQAISRDDDTELRYQLGSILREAEDHERALEHLLLVRKRDIATHEVEVDEAVPADEADDLRRHLEEVLDTLPDPVINRVAAAAIRVERWVSEAAVRAGCDPRTAVAFEGRPSDDDGDGQIDALVIFRDAIVALIDNDDAIIDVIALGLVEEFDRFFDLELIPGM